MVFRIFVEKKRGIDSEEKNLLGYIKNYISFEPETEIRLFDRYDFDGVTKENFDDICKHILVNENTRTSFIDYLPLTSEWRSFVISPIDGKYVDKIDNLRSTARTLGISGNYKINHAKIIAVSNILNDYKLEEVKKLLIDNQYYNFVDSNKALSIEDEKFDFGETVVDEDFLEKNDIQIYQYLIKTSLKMSKEMLCIVRDYFRILKRNPTLIELYAIDCCLERKNSADKLKFKEINFEDASVESPLKITLDEFINLREQARIDKTGAISLEDIAGAGYDYMKQRGQVRDISIYKGQPLIQTPVDINGVVEQYFLSFKVGKTNKNNGFDVFPHNSFNALEAYQSLNLDCRPFVTKKDYSPASNSYDNVTIGDDVTNKAAQMNRKLGICSALGGQIFSKSVKKPINFFATAFAGSKADFSSKVLNGDLIVMLGSKFRVNDLYYKDFSQRMNFSMQEKINQFFKAVENESFIKKSLDFSNGIICGILDEFDGVTIDINRIVAAKYLPYSHLVISVKTCRAAVVVSRNSIDRIKDICSSLGLSSHIIGEINDSSDLIINNGKKQLANISTEFIKLLKSNEKYSVLIKDKSNRKIPYFEYDETINDMSFKDAFLQNLKNVFVCSKKGISSSFDSTVGGGCVLAPFSGVNEITPSDAFVCKIPTENGNTNTVTSISFGCNPKISEISPYHGAAFSIMECISKIVASGANSINTKLGICQSMSDPKGFESKYSDLFSAVFGAFSAEIGMNIPSISYDLNIEKNDDDLIDFSCFALSVLKANEVISPDFKFVGSTIILVPMPIVYKTGLPDYDKAKIIYRQIHYLSKNGKVLSASVVNYGGIAATVAKMSFGNGIGVEFESLDKNTMFSAKTASIIIETKNPGAFSGMDTIIIGKTIDESKFVFDNESLSLNEALSAYTGTMQSYYPTRTTKRTAMAKIDTFGAERKDIYICKNKNANPKVIIPVFSAFSGAVDCSRAFKNAGGNTDIYFVNTKDYKNSLKTLSDKIEESQIICLPSGALYDFSVELGYNVMTNPVISESVVKLLNRDGLIIGFEEGFNILLKTGLLTSGIFKANESSVFLSDNINSMPVSGFVRTKVVSNKSPWMADNKVGEIFSVPVFHKNARFIADEVMMLSLINNHQIAMQYVDKNGKAAAKMPYNPDSSVCAVESIFSPDGRILGKISQPQRRTRGCFANISGNKDLKLFKSGINYFKD